MGASFYAKPQQFLCDKVVAANGSVVTSDYTKMANPQGDYHLFTFDKTFADFEAGLYALRISGFGNKHRSATLLLNEQTQSLGQAFIVSAICQNLIDGHISIFGSTNVGGVEKMRLWIRGSSDFTETLNPVASCELSYLGKL